MGAGHGDGKSTLFPSQRSKQSCFLTKIAKALKKKNFLFSCLFIFLLHDAWHAACWKWLIETVWELANEYLPAEVPPVWWLSSQLLSLSALSSCLWASAPMLGRCLAGSWEDLHRKKYPSHFRFETFKVRWLINMMTSCPFRYKTGPSKLKKNSP